MKKLAPAMGEALLVDHPSMGKCAKVSCGFVRLFQDTIKVEGNSDEFKTQCEDGYWFTYILDREDFSYKMKGQRPTIDQKF